jgi:asparagine synthase (glutamine-hydrolysing)
MPAPLRRSVARMLAALPTHQWERLVAGTRWLLPASLRDVASGDKFHKLAEVLKHDDPGTVYLRFLSHWTRPDGVVLGAHEPQTILTRGGGPRDLDGFTDRMMLLDTLTYLPDDILVKVDRASMAVSLEARAPLLDHRVVEYAAGLRVNQKLRDGRGKWALRRVLSKYVPDSLIDRPKMGFGVPLAQWLRGTLRDWAEDLLGEQRLRRDGFFDPRPIRALWEAHQAGTQDAQYLLWDVLMFQAWQDENRLASASRAA